MTINKKHCTVAALALACATRIFADATLVQITDEVLHTEVPRMGLNVSGDSVYSSPMMKKRIEENFEGTMYRQAHAGELFSDGFATYQGNIHNMRRTGWLDLYEGAEFTILSGPAKGHRGRITAVQTRPVYDAPRATTTKEVPFFVFDRPVEGLSPTPARGEDMDKDIAEFNARNNRYVGLLIDIDRTGQGYLSNDGNMRPNRDNPPVLHHDDLDPNTFGQSCILMDGSAQLCDLGFDIAWQRYADANGSYTIRFHAKTSAGNPQLVVRAVGRQLNGRPDLPSETIRLSDQWQEYEITMDVSGINEPTGPDNDPRLQLYWEVTGGSILLDDIEAWDTRDQNPTAFRDDYIRVLQSLEPGILRQVKVGGDTVINFIRPRLQSFRTANGVWMKPAEGEGDQGAWGMHEVFDVCNYIGASPWFCLPGTMRLEEIDDLMEYLGAPANVGLGRLRAELGQVEPWTHVLDQIHLEPGNEAWNAFAKFACGGYNGEDYWQDIFTKIKASPYYRDNIICHAAGQNFSHSMSERILEATPAADRYAIAPYIAQELNQHDLEVNPTLPDQFRWLFGQGFYDLQVNMQRQQTVMDRFGTEFSIYEINHHMTHGDARPEDANTLVTSICAGLNVQNTMLSYLKDYGMRDMCIFTLSQTQFFARKMGPEGSDGGNVRLWGIMLACREDSVRYRPTGLAFKLTNHFILDELLQTTQSGENPSFTALLSEFNRRQNSYETTPLEFPGIRSFAFRDGPRRSLILFNLDVENDRQVELRFPGSGGPAESWLLSADSPEANNEFEVGEPQVEIIQASFPITSGMTLTLPKHSMMGIRW